MEAQEEHREIVAFLEAGAVDQAITAMRLHVERSQDVVRMLMRTGITAVSFAGPDHSVSA
jgi:DNA-binding FadR family transcriptional regulator